MKKMLLASAVAALSVGTAQAAPQVYGKAFVALDATKIDTTSSVTGQPTQKTSATPRPTLTSIGSRIGFKGSEALSPNTNAVYKLEYGINLDNTTNDQRQFTSRETYIGLENKQYGTLKVGRIDNVDGEVDYANITTGGLVGAAAPSFDGPRYNNAVSYTSPQYNATTLMAVYAMDENAANSNDAFGVAAKFEPTDAPYKAGVSFTNAPFSADVDYIPASPQKTLVQAAAQNIGKVKSLRVSGSYDVAAGTTVNALYQVSDFGKDAAGRDRNKEHALIVSGEYKYGQTPWTTYAQVDLTNNVFGVRDVSLNKQRFAVGGKYDFSSRTTGHVYGGYERWKTSASSNGVTASSGINLLGVGAGLEHKF